MTGSGVVLSPSVRTVGLRVPRSVAPGTVLPSGNHRLRAVLRVTFSYTHVIIQCNVISNVSFNCIVSVDVACKHHA